MKPVRHHHFHSASGGFTFTELLVTVSIVLVLLSLLLPAVGATRQRAQRIQCLDNQRQMLLGWSLFSLDHRGALPSNGYVPGRGSRSQPRWVQGYLNPRVAPADLADETLLIDADYAQLAPYLPRASIYHCPEDRSPPGADPATGRIRSYAMNAYVGWDGPLQRPLLPEYRIYRTTGDLGSPGPSRLMVFTEVRPESICWPFFGVNMTEGALAQFFAFPATHHAAGAQIAFADGHVEYRKWRDRRTLDPGHILYHAHDQPSPGNVNLAWLQSVTTARR